MRITVLNRVPEAIKTTWEGVTREREQVWATLEVDGLPTSFQVTSDPGKSPKPGNYQLGAKSFNVQNGRLTIQRVVLEPVTAPGPKA